MKNPSTISTGVPAHGDFWADFSRIPTLNITPGEKFAFLLKTNLISLLFLLSKQLGDVTVWFIYCVV